jgi:hypothetical protein
MMFQPIAGLAERVADVATPSGDVGMVNMANLQTCGFLPIQPTLKTRVERKMLHIFSREPSRGIGFPHAKCLEGLVGVGHYDVELPVAAAILYVGSRDSIRRRGTNLLFGLASSCHFGGLSVSDCSPRNAPRTPVIHRPGALLQQVRGLTVFRCITEKQTSASGPSPMDMTFFTNGPKIHALIVIRKQPARVRRDKNRRSRSRRLRLYEYLCDARSQSATRKAPWGVLAMK